MLRRINIEEIETQFENANQLENYKSSDYTDSELEHFQNKLKLGWSPRLYFNLFQVIMLFLLYLFSTQYELNNRLLFLTAIISFMIMSLILNKIIMQRFITSMKYSPEDAVFLSNFSGSGRALYSVGYFMVLFASIALYDIIIAFFCVGLALVMIFLSRLRFKRIEQESLTIKTHGIYYQNVHLDSLDVIISKIPVFGATKTRNCTIIMVSSSSLNHGLKFYPDHFGRYFFDLAEIIMPNKKSSWILKNLAFRPLFALFLSTIFYILVSSEFNIVYLLYILNVIILDFVLGILSLFSSKFYDDTLQGKLGEYFDNKGIEAPDRKNILENMLDFLLWHTVLNRTMEPTLSYFDRVLKAHEGGYYVDSYFSDLSNVVEISK